MSKQSQPGLSDVLPDSNATPAVTHTTTPPAASGATPAAPAPSQSPAQARKPGKVARVKGKPEITGEPEATTAPVPEPARGRTGSVLKDRPPLLPGMKVAYWMPAKKNAEVRTIFGFETDLFYRHAVIVEVHPAGVVHLLLGEPGGWIPLNCDETETPQVGRFTRLTRADLESLGL